MITGMVFGVFDGLHEGHREFLRQAIEKTAERSAKDWHLVVVLTTDEVSEQLKKRRPKKSYVERAADLFEFNPQLAIVEGDTLIGSWNVLKEHRPDIVFLGYDQQAIAAELKKLGVSHEFLKPFKPETFKSSLMHG
jgi:cytidyltransferase-like protein